MIVSPTKHDPVAAAGSAFLGGPRGRWARSRPHQPAWALLIILTSATVSYAIGVLRTLPCMRSRWAQPDTHEFLCYSDIPVLYYSRGLAEGLTPYLEWPVDGQPLEYPVLTGMFMLVAARITALLTGGGSDQVVFYQVNLALLYGFFIAMVLAVALTVQRRVWDGLLLALAPSVFLAATINWDVLAVSLAALALLAWSRERAALAGVLLGLAAAAKFYPLLFLGPLVVLAWRRRREWPAVVTVLWTLGTWAVVNLPFAIANAEGWRYFFTFSRERREGFGSLWLAMRDLGLDVPDRLLNPLGTLLFALLCLAVAGLILTARVPPRLSQVIFLVVAAFLVTNKVYSPQFVMWLLPLAVLARPRWRDFLIWQATEVVYFVAVWWYLVELGGGSGLDARWHAAATLLHIAGIAYLAAVIVRDILAPEHDPVRADGAPPGKLFDDPGGGVFDAAPVRPPVRPQLRLGLSPARGR